MSAFVEVETAIENARAQRPISTRTLEDYLFLLEKVKREKFRSQAHARAWELARQQGVVPIRDIEELPGDPCPEEDSVDEFLSWIYSIRRQDKDRSGLE